MKKKFIAGAIVLFALFCLLFLFRLGYGYITTPNGWTRGMQQGFFEQFSYRSKNYASAKGKSAPGISRAATQKYEKIASLGTKSRDFEDDEKKVRLTIGKFQALIQFEEMSGLKSQGNRRLNLGIGVKPERFDIMVQDIQSIGEMYHIAINKTDKTNEYKNLNAKKASLVTMRDGLKSLKGKGSVKELISLENRLLEIEEQIQNLGVSLGEFDEENEFCTIKLSLVEARAEKPRSISFIHRAKVALEWTLKYYTLLVTSLFFASLFILLALVITDKAIKMLAAKSG